MKGNNLCFIKNINKTQTQVCKLNLFSEEVEVPFAFLLFLLRGQVLDVVYGLQEHHCLANLVARGICLLTGWHKFLKRIITILD